MNETIRYSWLTKKAVLAYHSPTEENWAKFRDIRNKSKPKIKETKTAFSKKKKKLSSKTFKEIWKVVHKILKPNDSTLKVDTIRLSKYFNDTAARLVSPKSMIKKELTSLIDSFNDKENAIQLQPLTYWNIEVYKNDTKWLFDGIWSYTCIFHKTSFRILSLTKNFYNKQFHQNRLIPRLLETR